MQEQFTSHSFIIQNFQEFYHEVLRQKARALRDITLDQALEELDHETRQAKSDEGDRTKDEQPQNKIPQIQNLVADIQAKLRELLEHQSVKATREVGEFAVSNFREAEYLMAALADEVFIYLKWNGQKQWERNILEAQLFQTSIAGEQFFEKLEHLIQTNDPMRRDLAVIYLMILGLGFRGRYRDVDDAGKIEWYRNQLLQVISGHSSRLYNPNMRERLVQQCYDHSISDAPAKGLPDIKLWLIIFAATILIYLMTTYGLWYKIVKDMDQAVNAILQQSQELRVL